LSVISNPASGVASGTVRFEVKIYKIEEGTKDLLKEIGTLSDKLLSHVLWSSNGAFFALVNTDKNSANIGFLEFGLLKQNNALDIVKSTKVSYMNYAEWDPSGRCLVTGNE